MFRDRLVVGLSDTKISLKLQMDPQLTLKKRLLGLPKVKQLKSNRPTEQPPNIDQIISKQTVQSTYLF